MYWLLFSVRFTPVLPQWRVKDPGHSIKSAGGRFYLNTHTPLTQRSRSGLTMPMSRHSVGTLSGNELIRNSSGYTWSQSSQLAEPMWTDPGLKSGISMRELISTLNKKKKRRQGMNCRTFSQNPRTRGKSHHHLHTVQVGFTTTVHVTNCWPQQRWLTQVFRGFFFFFFFSSSFFFFIISSKYVDVMESSHNFPH